MMALLEWEQRPPVRVQWTRGELRAGKREGENRVGEEERKGNRVKLKETGEKKLLLLLLLEDLEEISQHKLEVKPQGNGPPRR